MRANTKLNLLLKNKKNFTTSEAKALGISKQMLAYYYQKGEIQKICRGVYSTVNSIVSPYPELEQLVSKNSNFVICLLSALQIHEMTTQSPTSFWIAIEQGSRIPKIDDWELDVIRSSSEPYNYGIQQRNFYGMDIKIYSPAKTIADCFKYRNKIGLDVALESLQDGYKQKLFTPNELMQAAQVCRVTKIITPYMESLLQ